jgi:hypothetical protein
LLDDITDKTFDNRMLKPNLRIGSKKYKAYLLNLLLTERKKFW